VPTPPWTDASSWALEAHDWVPLLIKDRLVVVVSLHGRLEIREAATNRLRSAWDHRGEDLPIVIDSEGLAIAMVSPSGVRVAGIGALGFLEPWRMVPVPLGADRLVAIRVLPDPYSSKVDVVEILLDDGDRSARRLVRRSGAGDLRPIAHRLVAATGTKHGFLGITPDGWLSTDERVLGTAAVVRGVVSSADATGAEGREILVVTSTIDRVLVRRLGDEVAVTSVGGGDEIIDARVVRRDRMGVALARTLTALEMVKEFAQRSTPGFAARGTIAAPAIRGVDLRFGSRVTIDTCVYDVFISYSRRDSEEVAVELYRALTARGLRVFLDVKAGLLDNYEPQINATLERSRAIVIVWSATTSVRVEEPGSGMSQYDEILNWLDPEDGYGNYKWKITVVVPLAGVDVEEIPSGITQQKTVRFDSPDEVSELVCEMIEKKKSKFSRSPYGNVAHTGSA